MKRFLEWLLPCPKHLKRVRAARRALEAVCELRDGPLYLPSWTSVHGDVTWIPHDLKDAERMLLVLVDLLESTP